MTQPDDQRKITAPVITPLGDGFQLEWEEGVRAEVSYIKDTRDDVYGYVAWFQQGVDSWDELPGAGKLNMTAPRSRGDLAKTMATLVRDGWDWTMAVEQLAHYVVRGHRDGPPVRSMRDLMALDRNSTNVRYAIDKLIPAKQTTVIHGDPSAGKSILTQAMAIAFATSRPFAGEYAVNDGGPVLYLDWETDERQFWRRLGLLLRGAGVPEDQWDVLPIHYRRMIGGMSDGLTPLRKMVDRLHVKLVVVDSVGWATADDPKEAAAAIKVMDAARALDATTIVLAHQTKEARQGGGAASTIFGSVFYEAAARSVWAMRSAQKDESGTRSIMLQHKKANDSPLIRQPLGFSLEFVPGEARITSTLVTAVTGQALRDRILKSIGEAGPESWLTATELAAILGMNRDSVRRTCQNLVGDEVLVQRGGAKGRGQEASYALADRAMVPQPEPLLPPDNQGALATPTASVETAPAATAPAASYWVDDEDSPACVKCGRRDVGFRFSATGEEHCRDCAKLLE